MTRKMYSTWPFTCVQTCFTKSETSNLTIRKQTKIYVDVIPSGKRFRSTWVSGNAGNAPSAFNMCLCFTYLSYCLYTSDTVIYTSIANDVCVTCQWCVCDLACCRIDPRMLPTSLLRYHQNGSQTSVIRVKACTLDLQWELYLTDQIALFRSYFAKRFMSTFIVSLKHQNFLKCFTNT